MLKPSISSIREQQHPLIRRLADQIEVSWTQYLDLEPYNLPEDLGYVEGKLEGEKLTIENKCFQTRQFRKLHLELAKVGQNLDILHCVMFPRADYDIPMFGTDLVGGRGQISAAIVDLSTTRFDKSLPESYQSQLQTQPGQQFSQPREIPTWGDIFSEFCLFIRPTSVEEESQFLDIVTHYLAVHCQYAIAQTPVSADRKVEIAQGQKHYCTQQQQNDKTRRVLEKAFGQDWANYYMATVLFDVVED